MATLTINNSNKPTAMRLRLTYTSGQGNITISKIESCRTDGYGTTDLGTCTIKVKVGGTTKSYNKTGVYFNANSSYTTLLQQNISFDVSGNQSVNITFTSANDNIANSNFTTTINAGVKTATLTLNNAYDSSHRLNITTSGATLNYTLANTNNLTTSLQYYVGEWKTFETRNANGSYSYTITQAQTSEILSYYNNTSTPNIQLRVNNTNGASSNVLAYLSVDNSIIPTLGSISVSAYCDVVGFENLFVKGLSKPVITFNNASGVLGSTISSYYIKSLTGDERADFVLSMNGNVTNTSNFNNLSVEGTNSVVAYVKDSRSRNSANATQTFNVIDYNTPSLISVSIRRCTQTGVLNEDGTYGSLSVSYKVYPVNDGTEDRNYETLFYSLDNENWTAIILPDWENTITRVIGGSFDTSQTYTIYVKLEDRTTTVLQTLTIAPSKKLISRYHGNDGEGVTLGKVASEPGFHDYLGANFHNGLKINSENVLPRAIMTLTTSSDVSLTLGTNYNISNFELYNNVGTGLTAGTGGVTIGAGITKVLVSAKGQYSTIANSTNSRYIKIRKNSTEICLARTQPVVSSDGLSLALTPILLDVQQGDVIGMSIQGASGDVFRSTIYWTYLTVEVVN